MERTPIVASTPFETPFTFPQFNTNPTDVAHERENVSSSTLPITRANSVRLAQKRTISDPMMRTVVANNKDALNLLFEAAQHNQMFAEDDAGYHLDTSSTIDRPSVEEQRSIRDSEVTSPTAATSRCSAFAGSLMDAVKAWNSCRFVRMGWFTAQEAISYIEL